MRDARKGNKQGGYTPTETVIYSREEGKIPLRSDEIGVKYPKNRLKNHGAIK